MLGKLLGYVKNNDDGINDSYLFKLIEDKRSKFGEIRIGDFTALDSPEDFLNGLDK